MSHSSDASDMQRLVSLIRFMNAIHSDAGDFRCLRSCDDDDNALSDSIARNSVLREILEHIIKCSGEEGADANSTLRLDCSGVFDKEQRIRSFGRIQTLFALKSFLRLNEDDGARKYLGLVSLVRSLPEQVKIVRIDISHNALGDNYAVTAASVFRGLDNLTGLNMAWNQIGIRGVEAIFSVLISHPSCKLESLNLLWNWPLCRQNGESEILQERLIQVLLNNNKSLKILILDGTSFEPTAAIARVFYDFSDEGKDSLFDIPTKYNHNLNVLRLDTRNSAETKKLLLSALKMNEGGPNKAIGRKIEHYLEKNKTKVFDDENNADPDLVVRTLEIVGKYCSMATMLKSVQRFIVNGALFGTGGNL